MKKIFLSLFFLLATLTGAMAAKSAGIPRLVQQPDGTAMQILLLGDEHFSWYQTTDGVLLVEDNNVFYVAKTNYYGDITSTGVIAHEAALRTPEELSAIGRQNKDIFFSIGPEVSKSKAGYSDFSILQIPGYPSTKHCPHTGKVRVPV
ncbi:MAG: hypothetical protein KBT34_14575, partial [Prevotella sp.]|nr:hypothetical protein [Candidatus Prevotella equi]